MPNFKLQNNLEVPEHAGFIIPFHLRNTVNRDGRSLEIATIKVLACAMNANATQNRLSSSMLKAAASWNSVYRERRQVYGILITPEVLLQSIFPRFYSNCLTRTRKIGPADSLRIQDFIL